MSQPVKDAAPPQLNYHLPCARDIQTRTKQSDNIPGPVDVLLVTVKDYEFRACYMLLNNPYRCWFNDLGYVYFDDVEEGRDEEEKVKVALLTCHEGSGVPGGSLLLIRNAVKQLRPKAVIAVGACSGLKPEETKLGDVVVSTKLSSLSSGMRSYVSRCFLNLTKNCADGWKAPLKDPEARDIKVHCNGEFLSGAEEVRALRRREQLAESHPQAMAIELEGEGVFAAAFDGEVEWLIVKGIADYADGDESTTQSWSPFASMMAASVVSHILGDHVVFHSWPHYGDSSEKISAINLKRKSSSPTSQDPKCSKLGDDAQAGTSSDAGASAAAGANVCSQHEQGMPQQWKSEMEDMIKQWKSDEGSTKEKLEEIKEMVKQWKFDEDSTKSKLREMEGHVKRWKEVEGSTKDKIEELEEMLKRWKSNEDSSKDKLREVEDTFDPAELIDVIRDLYKRREGWLAPIPWCEHFRFHLDTIFTRLKMVSRKKERGTKTERIVDMFKIFHPHEECPRPRKVLIEGQPGMGKTTYCNKIAYDWAKKCRKTEESFPDVEVFLLLKCRDIDSDLDLWGAIDDQLLPRDMKEEEREKFFTFVKNHQSSVLLVLDGLDELPTDALPVYKEIVQGRMLPKCHLVVTARPEAGIKVRECCDTLLEVEGFTDGDAKDFILKYFNTNQELSAKLLDKLNSDESLKDLMTNPLNTALLCLLCEDFHGIFPESRTLLFLEIVQCVLRRYRRKKELPKTDQDLTELYGSELKQLGCVALNGLLNDDMYFERSAFQNCSNDLPGFGFLSVQPGRSKRRPSLCYGFPHKSFQEFLAARYIVQDLKNAKAKNLTCLSKLNSFEKCKKMVEVLKFVCEMSSEAARAVFGHLQIIAEKEGLAECRFSNTPFLGELSEDEREFRKLSLDCLLSCAASDRQALVCAFLDCVHHVVVVDTDRQLPRVANEHIFKLTDLRNGSYVFFDTFMFMHESDTKRNLLSILRDLETVFLTCYGGTIADIEKYLLPTALILGNTLFLKKEGHQVILFVCVITLNRRRQVWDVALLNALTSAPESHPQTPGDDLLRNQEFNRAAYLIENVSDQTKNNSLSFVREIEIANDVLSSEELTIVSKLLTFVNNPRNIEFYLNQEPSDAQLIETLMAKL